MANEALLIYKKLTCQEESTWAQGTITPGTKLLALRETGIVIGAAPTIIKPGRVSGRASFKKGILGTLAPKMTVPFYGFPTGLAGKLIKCAIGQSVDAEVASFIVSTGVNDTLDFNIGAGNLVATVAAGTYAAGLTQADAGSTLCKLIYNALVAAEGAGTYTVAYSTTTKKFTITRSAGTFQMKFATGPNTAKTMAPLIGFATADQTGALTYTSGNTVEHVFTHTMKPLDAIAYGLSTGLTFQVGMAAGPLVYDVTDSVIDELKMTYKPNEELQWDAMVEARKIATSAASLAGLTEETVAPLLYSQLAFTFGGVTANLAELQLAFKNNYHKALHINSQYRSKFVRNGFRDVSGAFKFELTDANAYSCWTQFLAGTQPALVATFTGTAIKGALNFSYAVNFPQVQLDLKDVPGGGGQAVPAANIPFIALDDGTNGEMYVTIQNNEATI